MWCAWIFTIFIWPSSSLPHWLERTTFSRQWWSWRSLHVVALDFSCSPALCSCLKVSLVTDEITIKKEKIYLRVCVFVWKLHQRVSKHFRRVGNWIRHQVLLLTINCHRKWVRVWNCNSRDDKVWNSKRAFVQSDLNQHMRGIHEVTRACFAIVVSKSILAILN